jgi:2-dehydro-3-deoxyphosphogluconate aldolase/(4S)-4-hydroxy-2-oxoglutarate aldolase
VATATAKSSQDQEDRPEPDAVTLPTAADLAAALHVQKALPLFTCGDPAAGVRVLESLHAAGFRIVEFTNRAPGNVDVFRTLAAEGVRRLPGLVLGAGTILDVPQAEAFHAAGAAFIVAPHLDEEVGRWCAARGVPWCPGTGTVTEMLRGHRLGAAVIKVFPADALGGPAFLKAVRGPLPWLPLMPSGGVTLDDDNLRDWFAANAHCVGIGSQLVDASLIATSRFDTIAERARRLATSLAAIG